MLRLERSATRELLINTSKTQYITLFIYCRNASHVPAHSLFIFFFCLGLVRMMMSLLARVLVATAAAMSLERPIALVVAVRIIEPAAIPIVELATKVPTTTVSVVTKVSVLVNATLPTAVQAICMVQMPWMRAGPRARMSSWVAVVASVLEIISVVEMDSIGVLVFVVVVVALVMVWAISTAAAVKLFTSMLPAVVTNKATSSGTIIFVFSIWLILLGASRSLDVSVQRLIMLAGNAAFVFHFHFIVTVMVVLRVTRVISVLLPQALRASAISMSISVFAPVFHSLIRFAILYFRVRTRAITLRRLQSRHRFALVITGLLCRIRSLRIVKVRVLAIPISPSIV